MLMLLSIVGLLVKVTLLRALCSTFAVPELTLDR
jgi:hypothetical protein